MKDTITVNGKTYTYHHSASRRGYESRKGGGHLERYSGKFGAGYIAVLPRWDTTQFVTVRYYLA